LSLLIIGCGNSNSDNTENIIPPDSTKLSATESNEANKLVEKEKSTSYSQDGKFEDINTDYLKALLVKEKKALSAKDVIKLYYPAKIQNENNSYEKIDIQTKKEGNNTIVTLVHDNQPHVSIQGHRIVMTLTKNNNQWEVLSIAQQFKCWSRKDGLVWGTNKCS